MTLRGQLLQLLSDGGFYSGTWLGQRLGISRSAVWKHIHFLQTRQVDIYAVRGRGYRLARPVELLQRQLIMGHLEASAVAQLARLDILTEVDSSNRYLLARARQGGVSGDFCLAEYQSAGRGRLERRWVSPFAANIYLSLLWRFPCEVDGLAGLGLAVGVSLLRVVRRLGAKAARLKWPNDLVCQNKKLAGILLEVGADANGRCHVVIGIGLNLRMPRLAAENIDQPWTDLEQILGRSLSRNFIAAAVIQQLLSDMNLFQAQGLAPFLKDWRRFDSLLDQPVFLSIAGVRVTGIARGIDNHGALRLDSDGHIQRYLAGDVSVRAML